MSHPGYPPQQPSQYPSQYPSQPSQGASPVAPPRRPLTLTLGYIGALLAALFSAAGATLLIIQARDLAEETAAEIVGEDVVAALGSELSTVIDEATSTLVFRGVSALVSALLVLGFALALRNGALWARIVVTILMLGTWCANGIVMRDVAPTATKALGAAAIVLSLAVIVLLFLPPTNAYAKARRQVTR